MNINNNGNSFNIVNGNHKNGNHTHSNQAYEANQAYNNYHNKLNTDLNSNGDGNGNRNGSKNGGLNNENIHNRSQNRNKNQYHRKSEMEEIKKHIAQKNAALKNQIEVEKEVEINDQMLGSCLQQHVPYGPFVALLKTGVSTYVHACFVLSACAVLSCFYLFFSLDSSILRLF